MDEDRFNLALRGFLKEVGVTSQREIEKLVREHPPQAGILRLRMALTSPDDGSDAGKRLGSCQVNGIPTPDPAFSPARD